MGRSRLRARAASPTINLAGNAPISRPRDALRGHMTKRHAFRAVCRDWVLCSGADVFGRCRVRSRSVWWLPRSAPPIQVDVAVLARTGRGRPCRVLSLGEEG